MSGCRGIEPLDRNESPRIDEEMKEVLTNHTHIKPLYPHGRRGKHLIYYV
jgi:hypothetical protein